MSRININASTVATMDPGVGSEEFMVKVTVRREADGTFTVVDVEPYTWTASSKAERECIAAGCFGCINCD